MGDLENKYTTGLNIYTFETVGGLVITVTANDDKEAYELAEEKAPGCELELIEAEPAD